MKEERERKESKVELLLLLVVRSVLGVFLLELLNPQPFATPLVLCEFYAARFLSGPESCWPLVASPNLMSLSCSLLYYYFLKKE